MSLWLIYWGIESFGRLPLRVTSDVLIPRPDTERLVEVALQTRALDPSTYASPRILELGVGSGAISIVLAKESVISRIVATDISPAAVAVAKYNASQHGVDHRINFLVSDWFDALKPSNHGFDLLISNPPYIPKPDIAGLDPDVAAYEPLTALNGGQTGMDCLDHIIRLAPAFLKPGGYLILEMGYNQKKMVQASADNSDAYEEIVFHKDYAGHDRVVLMRSCGQN